MIEILIQTTKLVLMILASNLLACVCAVLVAMFYRWGFMELFADIPTEDDPSDRLISNAYSQLDYIIFICGFITLVNIYSLWRYGILSKGYMGIPLAIITVGVIKSLIISYSNSVVAFDDEKHLDK